MSKIFSVERGSGTPVILLHGFPFDHTLWNDFAEKLSAKFHVITPDLPGFGKSPLPPGQLTITGVADILLDWIKEKKFSKSFLIGHSLGGYVALAMAEKNPELFQGLGLFHSTATADSEEKKESRNKVLDFIDKNGVEKFTGNFIGPLFADQQHAAIPKVQAIGLKATSESVKSYTIAMRDRSEKTSVLRQFPGALMLLTGEKDAGIPVKSIQDQGALNSRAEVHILKDAAHMSMFEKADQSLQIIIDFLEKNRVTSR